MAETKASEAPSPRRTTALGSATTDAQKGGASQAQPTGRAGAGSAPSASAAMVDDLLAKEALASLKRARDAARSDAAKPKPRAPIPSTTIVVKPSQTQTWMTPFISLAMMVGICTIFCAGGMAYLFMRPIGIATTSNAEVRGLREAVAHLQRNVTSLSNDVATLHSALDAASKNANDRYDRLVQNLERAERARATTVTRNDGMIEEKAQVAYAAPATTSPEVTGSIRQQSREADARRESTVPGWSVRRAYEGVAVLAGQPGVIEVAVGQNVPDLGRIEDIKYENGRWLVLTSKGVIRSR